MGRREYASLTTYLNAAGTLVVIDATGAMRDDKVDVVQELGWLRGLGWQVVEVDTSETTVDDGTTTTTLLMTSYLLERAVGS